jgi:hypothetical protein
MIPQVELRNNTRESLVQVPVSLTRSFLAPQSKISNENAINKNLLGVV